MSEPKRDNAACTCGDVTPPTPSPTCPIHGIEGWRDEAPAATLASPGIVAYPRAFKFHLWLVSQAESNEIEGQQETADGLRELAQLALDHPSALEAYLLVRERGAS